MNEDNNKLNLIYRKKEIYVNFICHLKTIGNIDTI